MCEHGTTVPMPIHGRVQDIDSCLVPIVAALNAGGVPTVACCCGHGKINPSIILDDDRWLVIMPRAEAEAYFGSSISPAVSSPAEHSKP